MNISKEIYFYNDFKVVRQNRGWGFLMLTVAKSLQKKTPVHLQAKHFKVHHMNRIIQSTRKDALMAHKLTVFVFWQPVCIPCLWTRHTYLWLRPTELNGQRQTDWLIWKASEFCSEYLLWPFYAYIELQYSHSPFMLEDIKWCKLCTIPSIMDVG